MKVAGGVRCDKCGGVHTVITDVQGDLAPQLAKGTCTYMISVLHTQWKVSNPETLGTKESVLISEVP